MLDLSEELNQADRRAIDDAMFDRLGLTRTERDDVYRAVSRLVTSRSDKAKTLR